MVSQPSTAPNANGVAPSRDGMAEWLAQAIDQGVQPDQALAFMGLGLMRSLQVANYLAQNGFAHVVNLQGGIDAWSYEVDPSVPRY